MHPLYYLIIPLAGYTMYTRGKFLYKGIITKDRDRILVEIMLLLITVTILAGMIVLIENM